MENKVNRDFDFHAIYKHRIFGFEMKIESYIYRDGRQYINMREIGKEKRSRFGWFGTLNLFKREFIKIQQSKPEIFYTGELRFKQ